MDRNEAIQMARSGIREDVVASKTSGINTRIKAKARAGMLSLDVDFVDVRDVEAEAIRLDLRRRGFTVTKATSEGLWEVRW